MTPVERRRLQQQRWRRASDGVELTGEMVATRLVGWWKVTLEQLLKSGEGECVVTGVEQYVRVA